MELALRNGTIPLADGRLLAIRGARGVEVECTEGKVWLTIEGQPGDMVLGAGDRARIDSRGLALVEGLPSGAVRLLRPLSQLKRAWQTLRWRPPEGPRAATRGARRDPTHRDLPPVFG